MVVLGGRDTTHHFCSELPQLCLPFFHCHRVRFSALMFLVLFVILDAPYVVFRDIVDLVWRLWPIFGIHMFFWAHISRGNREDRQKDGV